MPRKIKKIKKPKEGFTICPDCGAEYKIGAPHMMFCQAHTCDLCASSFPDVLQTNENGVRMCDACWDDDAENDAE